jgi:hypothetical protein
METPTPTMARDINKSAVRLRFRSIPIVGEPHALPTHNTKNGAGHQQVCGKSVRPCWCCAEEKAKGHQQIVLAHVVS